MIHYEEVILDNDILQIANKTIRKYQNLLGPDDLEQCKQIGIWRGCTKYKPDNPQKCKLSTYIAYHINWECGRLIDTNKRYKFKSSNNLEQFIDCSRDLFEYENFNDIDEDELIIKRFQHKYTLKEIALETGLSIGQVRRKLDKIVVDLRRDLS